MKKLKYLLYFNNIFQKHIKNILLICIIIYSNQNIYAQNDSINYLNEIVVTGTKTSKTKTNSQIIVHSIDNKTLNKIQACNLSEGLKFQPGIRIETDCQTCNYTQLRINGLGGGYSQILINGRPIFSPLMSLYGMEQIPSNMIERIEVIKGAGSSLYGSSSIGGTVNVITKTPSKNNFECNYNYNIINNQTSDHMVSVNTTRISQKKHAGISIFLHNRNREFYDHNNDNFSEIPLVKNFSFGLNTFIKPTKNQKLEFNVSKLNEYRLGGEMIDASPHLMQQAEERTHSTWMTNVDYEIDINENLSIATYLAAQNTKRDHYTGIFPDGSDEIQNHLNNPPYGNSNVHTINTGIQINQTINNFINGRNILTLGTEYVHDDVLDEIKTYNYKTDQTTQNIAVFLQSDWILSEKLSLLSGLRLDQHNLIKKNVLSPRYSFLYKMEDAQIRLNYGEGFRAPQAFDTDLHMAFANGGVSRIQLSPELLPETSRSVSASINYDLPNKNYIIGFTAELFYTKLKNAFFLLPIGADAFGEVFEKRNGDAASIQGSTFEFRINYQQKVQVESGITIQSSEFENPITYLDGVNETIDFMRTPRYYGFGILNIYPNKKIFINISYNYTGKMQVPHFGGAINQIENEIITTTPFHEFNTKFNYTLNVKKNYTKIDLFIGVKNIMNAYQQEFDIGKYRDSNFIYGPSQPRTIFCGATMKI